MAAVFGLVFDLFDRLIREETRYTHLDFRKDNLRHYFVSSTRQNVSACLLSNEY